MNQYNSIHDIFKQPIQKTAVKRALRVAVLVGVILNIINNPELFNFSAEGISIYRVLLTFLVPFFVSLYSSVLASRTKCPETIQSN